MPAIAKYHPDLLQEAELVGDNVSRSMAFLKKHGFWREGYERFPIRTSNGKRALAEAIIKVLRNGS